MPPSGERKDIKAMVNSGTIFYCLLPMSIGDEKKAKEISDTRSIVFHYVITATGIADKVFKGKKSLPHLIGYQAP